VDIKNVSKCVDFVIDMEMSPMRILKNCGKILKSSHHDSNENEHTT
jgi:hypothetical protein